MNQRSIFKEIISALKELSKEMNDIKNAIKQLDYKKLPILLKKEAKVIEKLEKYAQTIQKNTTENDKNNVERISNILSFPLNVKDNCDTTDIITIRHLYSELIRKVFIIGNLVDQHINLYKIVYSNLAPVETERPKSVYIDKKM